MTSTDDSIHPGHGKLREPFMGPTRPKHTLQKLQMGLYATTSDITQRIKDGFYPPSQQRDGSSKHARAILERLGQPTNQLPPISLRPPPCDNIPRITVSPIPKHVNPEVNQQRQQDRATHLPVPTRDTYYADARVHPDYVVTAVVFPILHPRVSTRMCRH